MSEENITKLDLKSKDILSENIENIGKLFPNVIVETKEGKKIDFELLKQELSDVIIDGASEKYQLTWPGKKQAILEANTPIDKVLRPVKEKSVDFDNTKNIYIEGENLEVLKILQESYLRKIKCIYIDPPYNTGNDFIYRDDYRIDEEQELKDSGQVDEYNKKLIANYDSSGKFHSVWLSMMYPRLKLARNLLTDDGVIFISIDDFEYSNLKRLCDEIFGASNFVSNIIWYKNNSKGNVKLISNVTEYILCYAKNINNISEFRIAKPNAKLMCDVAKEMFEKNKKDIEKTNIEFRKWMKEHHITGGEKKYNKVDENGRLYTDKPLTAPGSKLYYDIIHPVTGKVCKFASRGWAYKKESFEELKASGHILFGKDETTCPYLKYFLDENIYRTPINHIQITANNANDMQLLGFNKSYFDYPKPSKLIEEILNFDYDSEQIILDFFSGSATTADAVMQINSKDNGKRRYIMVQLPEKCKENSEVYKLGYRTICDIAQERIIRAADKIRKETNAKIDYGFRVYKVDTPNVNDVYFKPKDLKQTKLGIFENNYKEDRTPEDLLIQVMLNLGLTLDLKIDEKMINNNMVYFVAENALVACLDNNVDLSILEEICKINPLRLVFKDESFITDNEKINMREKVKGLSPETIVSVI